MGVRGFTTFMSKHSDRFHESFRLKNCYVIIDGNGVAISLYIWHTKSYDCFGGDYDKYANTVYKFFDLLKRCNVTPIILFDGSYENRKLDKILSRMKCRISSIKKLSKSKPRAMNVFPLFTKEIFQDIALSLGIKCIRNDHESDSEIACLGRQMKCPILGYDSDFYFFDTLYIPFDTFKLRSIDSYDDRSKCYEHYIPCQVYKIDKFLKYFGGLNKTNLALLPVLIGNDYIKNGMFSSFFKHIKLKTYESENDQQRLIRKVICWLRNENFESAISKILGQFPEKEKKTISHKLRSAMKGYLQISSTITQYLKDIVIEQTEEDETESDILEVILNSNALNDITDLVDDCQEPKQMFGIINDEFYFIDKYRNCFLPQCFADIRWKNTHFCHPQVENYGYPNSHRISLDILACIHKILNPLTENPLKCVLRTKDTEIEKELLELYSGNSPSLADIQKSNVEQLKYHFLEILKIDQAYQEFLNMFPSDWHIFLLSLYYWKKNSKKVIDTSYIHSLIVCAIVLNFVDSKMDFCRSPKEFAKKFKIQHLNALRPKKAVPSESIEESFKNIEYDESLLCMRALLQFFSIKPKCVDEKLNQAAVVGYFSEFQSCVLHIKYLNALFCFPFDNFIFSKFFSGTFLYNTVVYFRRSNLKSYLEILFKDCTNVLYSVQLIMKYIEPYFGQICESDVNAKKQNNENAIEKKNQSLQPINEEEKVAAQPSSKNPFDTILTIPTETFLINDFRKPFSNDHESVSVPISRQISGSDAKIPKKRQNKMKEIEKKGKQQQSIKIKGVAVEPSSRNPLDIMPKQTFLFNDFKKSMSNEYESVSVPYSWQISRSDARIPKRRKKRQNKIIAIEKKDKQQSIKIKEGVAVEPSSKNPLDTMPTETFLINDFKNPISNEHESVSLPYSCQISGSDAGILKRRKKRQNKIIAIGKKDKQQQSIKIKEEDEVEPSSKNPLDTMPTETFLINYFKNPISNEHESVSVPYSCQISGSDARIVKRRKKRQNKIIAIGKKDKQQQSIKIKEEDEVEPSSKNPLDTMPTETFLINDFKNPISNEHESVSVPYSCQISGSDARIVKRRKKRQNKIIAIGKKDKQQQSIKIKEGVAVEPSSKNPLDIMPKQTFLINDLKKPISNEHESVCVTYSQNSRSDAKIPKRRKKKQNKIKAIEKRDKQQQSIKIEEVEASSKNLLDTMPTESFLINDFKNPISNEHGSVSLPYSCQISGSDARILERRKKSQNKIKAIEKRDKQQQSTKMKEEVEVEPLSKNPLNTMPTQTFLINDFKNPISNEHGSVSLPYSCQISGSDARILERRKKRQNKIKAIEKREKQQQSIKIKEGVAVEPSSKNPLDKMPKQIFLINDLKKPISNEHKSVFVTYSQNSGSDAKISKRSKKRQNKIKAIEKRDKQQQSIKIEEDEVEPSSKNPLDTMPTQTFLINDFKNPISNEHGSVSVPYSCQISGSDARILKRRKKRQNKIKAIEKREKQQQSTKMKEEVEVEPPSKNPLDTMPIETILID